MTDFDAGKTVTHRKATPTKLSNFHWSSIPETEVEVLLIWPRSSEFSYLPSTNYATQVNFFLLQNGKESNCKIRNSIECFNVPRVCFVVCSSAL